MKHPACVLCAALAYPQNWPLVNAAMVERFQTPFSAPAAICDLTIQAGFPGP